VEELRKAKEELFNLRFQSATGQLESHGRIRAVKRDIARLYTVIRERELGIRATPAPVEAPAKKASKSKAKKSEDASADAEGKAEYWPPGRKRQLPSRTMCVTRTLAVTARRSVATSSATRWTRPSSSRSKIA